MTAFAAHEAEADGLRRSWELRSVNGRGLDLRLRLPEGYGALEARLRKALAARVARGNVTLSLRVAQTGRAADGKLDDAAIAVAIERLDQLRTAATQHSMQMAPPGPGDIHALMPSPDPDDRNGPDDAVLMADLDTLLDAFCAMRWSEGAALAAVLRDRLAQVTDLVAAADAAAAARAAGQGDRLRAALAAILDATDAVDETRLAQELALIAVKSDITEEIDRLRAHVDACAALLDTGGPLGRKLDFLMQEFNREANTLCSKSADATLTAVGLDLKLAIDQMREQVQNLE